MRTLKGSHIGAALKPLSPGTGVEYGEPCLSYFSFPPFENFGLSIVPWIRNGNDSLPSFNLAPANRATVLVKKPCLVVIAATP